MLLETQKYIINIDSLVLLDKKAIERLYLVKDFELSCCEVL